MQEDKPLQLIPYYSIDYKYLIRENDIYEDNIVSMQLTSCCFDPSASAIAF